MTIDELYDAISNAEFRDKTPKENRWIRTKHQPKKGSSAFGPVQLTKGKAVDYADRHKKRLTPETVSFINRTVPMWDKMLEVGGEKGAGVFDYGGTGSFPNEDRDAYVKASKEFLKIDLEDTSSVEEAVDRWRGKSRSEDPKYYEAVETALWNDTMDKFDEAWNAPWFDPEGSGYDELSAREGGVYAKDASGHYPSRNPMTGQMLKGRGHKTWDLAEQGEEEAGYNIFPGANGKYYSQKLR